MVRRCLEHLAAPESSSDSSSRVVGDVGAGSRKDAQNFER